jgi:hypothetical protein
VSAFHVFDGRCIHEIPNLEYNIMSNPEVIKIDEESGEETVVFSNSSLLECQKWVEFNLALYHQFNSYLAVQCDSPYFHNGQWLH